MIKIPARISLVDKVTAKLSHEIMAGDYKARPLLPTEQKLIDRLGVSRTVIREATKQLVTRGLVEIQHGRGVKIVSRLHQPLNQSFALRLPDPKDRLEKLLEVRRLIEPAVARLAAMRARAGNLRKLHDVQARLRAADDAATAVELDMEFHRQLARAARNEVFELTLESLADLGRESRLATMPEFGWLQAHDSHARILSAVEDGDADKAERAMIEHVELAAVDLRAHFKRISRKRSS